jgi:hypothetical protein
MSPKAQAVSLLVVSVIFGVGPELPELVAGSGMAVPNWVKLLGALFGAAGTIVFAQMPALKQLAGGDGKNKAGAQGLTLTGSPSAPPPKGP